MTNFFVSPFPVLSSCFLLFLLEEAHDVAAGGQDHLLELDMWSHGGVPLRLA